MELGYKEIFVSTSMIECWNELKKLDEEFRVTEDGSKKYVITNKMQECYQKLGICLQVELDDLSRKENEENDH